METLLTTLFVLQQVYFHEGDTTGGCSFFLEREGLLRQRITRDFRGFYTTVDKQRVQVFRNTTASQKENAFYYRVYDSTDDLGKHFTRRVNCSPEDVYLLGTTTCVLDVPDPDGWLKPDLEPSEPDFKPSELGFEAIQLDFEAI